MPDDSIRLQKYLSERGFASRRKAAELIEQGRVQVDGCVVTEPGARIAPAQSRVEVDGEVLSGGRPPARTILLHKPRGLVCSRAAEQGRTVHELLGDASAGLVTGGRLDKDSEGVLLLSNDGALVNRLTHPRYGHDKVYRVTVTGLVAPATLRLLRSRMIIDDYQIRPVQVTQITRGSKSGHSVLEFSLTEGRNRQIRKMCERAGLTIHRLIRTQFAGLTLGSLRPGEWRDVSKKEIALWPAALGLF